MAVYPERRSGRLTGVWIAEVTHLGKRRRDRFMTKHEAERWEGLVKLTGALPADAAKTDAPAHPFGDVAKEALEHHPGWEGNRDVSRQQRLTYVVDVLGADTPIEDVKTTDLDRLVQTLKKRPVRGGKKMSAGTINRYLSNVSAVLSFAERRGYRSSSIRIPWQKEDGKRIHWLTDEQEEALGKLMIAEGRPDEELTLRVLTSTGMRWGEFEGLTERQIILDKEDAWINLDATKTDTPRDVPIEPDMARELASLVKRKAVPQYYTFRATLKRALKNAGQNPALSIHCLRHTTATRLVLGDVNLAIVKDFLGHKSINTTMRYTHVTKQSLQDAMKKISPHAGQSAETPLSEDAETPDNQGFPCSHLFARRIDRPIK